MHARATSAVGIGLHEARLCTAAVVDNVVRLLRSEKEGILLLHSSRHRWVRVDPVGRPAVSMSDRRTVGRAAGLPHDSAMIHMESSHAITNEIYPRMQPGAARLLCRLALIAIPSSTLPSPTLRPLFGKNEVL